MRIILISLMGAVIGFLVTYMALNFEPEFDFLVYAFEGTVVLMSATVLLLVMMIVMILSMRNQSKATLNGEEEDNRDIWLYKRFSDTNMVATGAIVLGIATLSLSVITDQPTWLLLTSLIVMISAFLLSMSVAALLNTFYPDRDLPTISEKDYSKKLLAASDEGERHVMLEGLYSSFTLLNFMLILSLIVLLLYSIITGSSQMFAIFVVGIVLIVSNGKYYWSIRNKT